MWDKKFFQKLAHLGVPDHMLLRSSIGFQAHWKSITNLFDQRALPEEPWDESKIKQLLSILNFLDSDKDPGSIRIGEREGRIATPYLADLCGNFCHGVGRSGNLTAAQPKAAGASLLQNLTNKLVLSLINSVGIPNLKGALTVPMGTGMSIALSLRGCFNHFGVDLHRHPDILMTQVDHKSPRKGIEFIGGTIQTIPGKFGKNYYAEEGVYVDMEDLHQMYDSHRDSASAIVSNSAFFAPRVPDNLKKIAKFAQDHNLIHVINNAYGIQSKELSTFIRKAIDAGRVDAIIQSTDKCFLTPVGGAVITSPTEEIINSISQAYAGRASASPVVQLLVSLLSMGKSGYRQKMEEQQKNRLHLEHQLLSLANSHHERIIACNNPVSCAMTLSHLSSEKIGELGGYLYNMRVTGPRVVNIHQTDFGTCTTKEELMNSAINSYIVMNAAIGVDPHHITEAILRLDEAFTQLNE
ncbi:MAG: O-phosphoseryl-tRNA(Sec) selenium transferase [Promethearchaeota archaeon]|nr:MAG: O-phosphoseryl-tRNA(Sec) selenium transferase [Candidatus Lokiarchaeota archaeon]